MMNATNNIATDLFYKIRSRFAGLKLGSESGEITINPEDARFFDFDYKDGENSLGHISISLAEENSMKVYFSTGITEKMNLIERNKWYKFLKELRMFAKRRLMSFDTRDIAKDNLDKRDYAFLSRNKSKNKSKNKTPVGESYMNESTMYGTRNVSYQNLLDTKLIVKHNRALVDDHQPGARARNISALFVENSEGERFKYPFIHLAGARAMQRHVANQGVPYDDIGRSIINMSEEIAQLRGFSNYVHRNHLLNDDTNNIVEQSAFALAKLREQIAKLSKQKNYDEYKESFYMRPSIDIPQEVIKEYTDKFTVRNFKEDIKSVFPILYRLTQENSQVEYSDIVSMTANNSTNDQADVEISENTDYFAKFENWIMNLGEDSAINSEDEAEREEAIASLQELVSQHFAAGVDGTNAIQSLKGIIEDPDLEDAIKQQAEDEGNNTDVRNLIKSWLEQSAPNVIEELDFGDFDEIEPGSEEGGITAEPEGEEEMPPEGEEMPPEGEEMPPEGEEMPPEGEEMPPEGEEMPPPPPRQESSNNKTGKKKNLNIKEVAEFIHSFYDRESGTFPKGPEGVCIMVGKKFGEQAETAARKIVERLAPQQKDTTMTELARIKQLSKW